MARLAISPSAWGPAWGLQYGTKRTALAALAALHSASQKHCALV